MNMRMTDPAQPSHMQACPFLDAATPLLSLVLATVGRSQELVRFFESLAVQDCSGVAVIVVDQNEDDRLAGPLALARERGIVVRHLRHTPPNLAAARNAGVQAARGQWLGFPDDDCWYGDSLLDVLKTRMTAPDQPEGVIIRWVEQGEPPVSLPTLSWERSAAFRDVPVASITLFIRRGIFDRIGGFDHRLGVGQWFGAGEETDLIMRALRENALVAYEPEGCVHHAFVPGQVGATAAARMAARSRARGTGALYAKHGLSPWVILRGLVSPVARPLLKLRLGHELAHGMAVMLGRLDGWIGWLRRHQ